MSEFELPRPGFVERHVRETIDVGRQIHTASVKNADTVPFELEWMTADNAFWITSGGLRTQSALYARDLAMRMRGLEPPRGCPHTDLNRARLPIPPHPRGAV